MLSLNGTSTGASSMTGSHAGGLSGSIESVGGGSSGGAGGSSLRLLRNDLLIAADSVTNAMQSLVNELNSENRVC